MTFKSVSNSYCGGDKGSYSCLAPGEGVDGEAYTNLDPSITTIRWDINFYIRLRCRQSCRRFICSNSLRYLSVMASGENIWALEGGVEDGLALYILPVQIRQPQNMYSEPTKRSRRVER